MLLNKKLKAYTLSEIIVVLVLTSIVVGLALSVLQLVQKQMTALKFNNENNLKVKNLETRLNLLFNQSEQIMANEGKIYFYKPNDTITAEFYLNTFVIGNDSLNIITSNFDTYFRGETIENGYIDAISFDTEINKNIYKPLFVYRANDAKTKLKAWE